MDLKEIGRGMWTGLICLRMEESGKALLDTVMNIRVS
jgi:hypothetical protein